MSKKGKVLALLKLAGEHGVTTAEFLRHGCGSRFGARIQELRDEGYRIDSERVRDGSSRYRLVVSTPGEVRRLREVDAQEPRREIENVSRLFEDSPELRRSAHYLDGDAA